MFLAPAEGDIAFFFLQFPHVNVSLDEDSISYVAVVV